MNILIISGSMQTDSQTLKVSKVLENKLSEKVGADAEIYDLQAQPLTLDIEKIWKGGTEEAAQVEKLQEKLDWADGFVIATPEWNGMATPSIKNLFEHVGQHMANKPSLLVTVSSSRGGAYPIAELRMTSYKNSHVNHIPENLIVRDVTNVFNSNEPEEGNNSDTFYHERSLYTLKVLVEYAKALKQVRDSGIIDREKYGNGM